LVSSCSSRDKLEFQEFFRTEIRADDSKIFTFTLITKHEEKERSSKSDKPERSKKGGGKKSSNKRNGGQQGGKMNRSETNKSEYQAKLANILKEQLILRLENNQYCRDGYIKLNTSLSNSMSSIRGECHESATAIDRKRFLNSL
jgi:hypothetical protein